ncbi:hypothetical protein LJC17_03590 [Acholeplasma sp. OttesenSCG-928-E16]|nr:hypothetical protein [Acholeplasma sp. OttesenSCG-928-E16]
MATSLSLDLMSSYNKESLGYLNKDEIKIASCLSYSKAISFLKGEDTKKRALAAFYFSINFDNKDSKILINSLKNEKKLYVRLYLQRALQKGNKETLNYLVESIPLFFRSPFLKPTKKKTYPLPRNLIIRIISHMNPNLFLEIKNMYLSSSIKIKEELIEALGFMCYHHFTLQKDDVYDFFLKQIDGNSDILTRRVITALTCFKNIKTLLFLDGLKGILPSSFHDEIKRSISVITPTALLNCPNIKTIIATKYFQSNEVKKLYKIGFRDFGENRVDSFLKKKNR